MRQRILGGMLALLIWTALCWLAWEALFGRLGID